MLDSLNSNNFDVTSKIRSNNQNDIKTEEKNLAKSNINSEKTSNNNEGIKEPQKELITDKVSIKTESQALDPKLANILKDYGVMINQENIKLISSVLKKLPSNISAGDLLGVLISRKVSEKDIELLSKYTNGSLNFSSLFSSLPREAIEDLRNSWNVGKVIEKIKSLIQTANNYKTKSGSSLIDETVDNLRLQDLLTIQPSNDQDGNIYFQWPIFWDGQDLPDCLEGEAFVPGNKNENGFGIRILVKPPNLGQTEISLMTRNKELYVHFGVDEKLKDVFRTIFSSIRSNILSAGNYTSVQFTIGNTKLHNFFSRETNKKQYELKNSVIDFKV